MKTPNLPANFAIVALSDNLQYLDALVDQQWQVWGYHQRQDLYDFFAQTSNQPFPCSWLLLDTQAKPPQVVGAITLSLDEMGDCQPPERNPWLGYLYINPRYRGQGLAKYLTQYAVKQAHQLGFGQVYLYASDETARYLRWGWQIIQSLPFDGEAVNVMRLG